MSPFSDASPPDEPREVNGVVLLGPDFFSRDADGRPQSPIACAFPRFHAVVSGRGIHAAQALRMMDYLEREAVIDDAEIYADAVALIIRDPVVLIRCDPSRMERCFASDEMLQRLLPKERIQFIGVHLAEVRDDVRRRGESWRISPQPRSEEEIVREIRLSRVQVGTGAVYYQNAPTGGRYLTYEEFSRIRPLVRRDPAEALARLREIVDLTGLLNRQGVRELRFFLPPGCALDGRGLPAVIESLERAQGADMAAREASEAERLFEDVADAFARAAGPELREDDESCLAWRTTMFCRLFDIDETTLEEYALGLSPEFRLNVRWLPGARFDGGPVLGPNGEPEFEASADPRTRQLISHFLKTWPGVAAVNVGRVTSAQTARDRSGEQREVFLIVLEDGSGNTSIRLVRMIKWDVRHRLDRGISPEQAIGETLEYRNYIFDRLRAITALGVAIPSFSEIRLEEEMAGRPTVPVFFFHREYVSGTATDKLLPARYGRPGFLPRLTRLLGAAAGESLVIGRASPRDGRLYFDDGDEMVQFTAAGLPERLFIAETTGSFGDWTTPLEAKLPQCLAKVRRHLDRARAQGRPETEIAAAVEAFADGLAGEIERMQRLLRDPAAALRSLFADRTPEPKGIRVRWDGILDRLERADAAALRAQAVEGLK
jgi:hypothetical protein